MKTKKQTSRKRKCRVCEKLYLTVVEDDYTGECAECEELSWSEQAKIIKKRRGY